MDSSCFEPPLEHVEAALTVLFELKGYNAKRLGDTFCVLPKIFNILASCQLDTREDYEFMTEQFLMELAFRADRGDNLVKYVDEVASRAGLDVSQPPLEEEECEKLDSLVEQWIDPAEELYADLSVEETMAITEDHWPKESLKALNNYPPPPPPPILLDDALTEHREVKKRRNKRSLPPPVITAEMKEQLHRIESGVSVIYGRQLPSNINTRSYRSFKYKNNINSSPILDLWKYAGNAFCTAVMRNKPRPVSRNIPAFKISQSHLLHAIKADGIGRPPDEPVDRLGRCLRTMSIN